MSRFASLASLASLACLACFFLGCSGARAPLVDESIFGSYDPGPPPSEASEATETPAAATPSAAPKPVTKADESELALESLGTKGTLTCDEVSYGLHRDVACDEKRCADAGGICTDVGGECGRACVKRLKDAGRVCQGSWQCSSKCIAPAGARRGAKAYGKCAPTKDLRGCFATVENKKVMRQVCKT